jgi:hypothetical protein
MKVRVLALIGLLVAIVTNLVAQDLDPDGAKGYVQNVFHHNDVDSINLYNGALTVPIAIGPSYPIGPKLRYQAMLVYTSKASEFSNPQSPQPDQIYTAIVADPSLGFGWNFAAGAIKKCGPSQGHICYVSPDGAEHTFGAQPPVDGYKKSVDSSRYYLHYIDGTSGYEMWDEDGNRYVFDWNVTGFDDPPTNYINHLGRGRNGWYLRRVEDSFNTNNAYTVEYFSGLRASRASPTSSRASVSQVIPFPIRRSRSRWELMVTLPASRT